MSALMSTPSLSIVVPTRDTRELTLRCLASIRDAASDAELIVVDDASSDDTAVEVRRRHPGAEFLRNDQQAGFTRTANRGLAAAGGDVLLLLNSDTEVTASGLSALRAAFENDARLGIAGAELRYPDGSAQWGAGREPTRLWLFGQASGLPALLGRLPGYRSIKRPGLDAGAAVQWVSGAAMAFRRDAWKDVGPLDEDYLFYCQDLDICLTAADGGWRVAVVPDFVVTHHHGATISASGGSAARYHPELMWRDLVRFAGKRGGPEAARAAARALRRGARLRLLARRLAGTLLGRRRLATWEPDTAAFAAGLAALEEILSSEF
jgi:GT2 family glycosyltransferase